MSFLDSAGHFTSIKIYFVLESELRKMTSDVIMMLYFRYPTSHGKVMVIFGFSISKYVYLVTFGRKKFANISVTWTSTGTQPCKGKGGNTRR